MPIIEVWDHPMSCPDCGRRSDKTNWYVNAFASSGNWLGWKCKHCSSICQPTHKKRVFISSNIYRLVKK